jgi:hypothetical protein
MDISPLQKMSSANGGRRCVGEKEQRVMSVGGMSSALEPLNPEKVWGDSKMPKITRVATTIVAHT